MLLLFRQGSPLISKSPFTSPFYDHLTLHVIPMLFTSVFALSHHAYFQLGQKTGPDAATILSVVFPSLLTFLILVLEFIMPRQTKFISIDEYRRCTRACNALETDETQQSLLSGCDMNATKILKGRPTYPEVGVSLLSYMSFSYIGCKAILL